MEGTFGGIDISQARHKKCMALNSVVLSSSEVTNVGAARHEIAPAIGFVLLLGLLDAHARTLPCLARASVNYCYSVRVRTS